MNYSIFNAIWSLAVQSVPIITTLFISSLNCTTLHVNPTVITINMYIFSLRTFHCNISLSVYIQKILSVCCVLECLNGCLQDVHLLTALNVWMTFSGNVYIFFTLIIPSAKFMLTQTQNHTHKNIHCIVPILVYQWLNMKGIRKYSLLNVV